MEPAVSERKWCSWCLKRVPHRLVDAHSWVRSVYKCTHCGNRTLPCRTKSCHAMVRGGMWDDEWCSYCDGTVMHWPGELRNGPGLHYYGPYGTVYPYGPPMLCYFDENGFPIQTPYPQYPYVQQPNQRYQQPPARQAQPQAQPILTERAVRNLITETTTKLQVLADALHAEEPDAGVVDDVGRTVMTSAPVVRRTVERLSELEPLLARDTLERLTDDLLRLNDQVDAAVEAVTDFRNLQAAIHQANSAARASGPPTGRKSSLDYVEGGQDRTLADEESRLARLRQPQPQPKPVSEGSEEDE
eukprot:Rmarinus@m.2469